MLNSPLDHVVAILESVTAGFTITHLTDCKKHNKSIKCNIMYSHRNSIIGNMVYFVLGMAITMLKY